jgi:hypothetical protein
MTKRRDPAVDAFLDERAHPLRAVIDGLRDLILAVDPRVAESIKWGGPTFVLTGTRANLATIVLRGRSAITLFFQEGASLPDPDGLLSGDADHVRTVRFESLAAVDQAREPLQKIVRAFSEANSTKAK